MLTPAHGVLLSWLNEGTIQANRYLKISGGFILVNNAPKDVWFPGYKIYPQICHFRNDATHLLLQTTDDNPYTIYSSVYQATEQYGYKSSLGIVVKPYVEGGAYPEMAPPYPAAVELREAFLAGHGIVMHGFDHSKIWQQDATRHLEVQTAILKQLHAARVGIRDKITGHATITMWFPWSCDHGSRGHGKLARESDYIYCAQRQPGGEYHHHDLDLPTRDLEVFQDSRDQWDMYPQLVANMKEERLYTHVWGHGTYYRGCEYDSVADDLRQLDADVERKDKVWSTSSERAARYIIERKYANILNWQATDERWSYQLHLSLPEKIKPILSGQDIYKMPLTIKHENVESGKPYYVYEEKEDGGCKRLKSWLAGTTLYYEAVPKNQTIKISTKSLRKGDSSPEVSLSVRKLDVIEPASSKTTRGGKAYEIIVNGRDKKSTITAWRLTVKDEQGNFYVDHLGRELNKYALPINDWLDSRRGKIIYFVERGYSEDDKFTLVAEVENADGNSEEVVEVIS